MGAWAMCDSGVYVPPLAAADEIVAGLRAEGWEGDALQLLAAYGLYVSSGLLAFSLLLVGEPS